MAEPNVVTVNGHDITIDADACESWEFFELVCEIGTEFDQTKVPAAFQLIELCTGIGKDEFIELCREDGKRSASWRVVLESVGTVLAAAVPKN